MAPLVSIDLIIRNKQGDYLLNYKGTRPAKDKWFFWGGTIKKAQEIETAFYNIIKRELKGVVKIDFKDAKFIKPMTHIYPENRKENVTDKVRIGET